MLYLNPPKLSQPVIRTFAICGTGLGFYNARYYYAGLGRFISPDSVSKNGRCR